MPVTRTPRQTWIDAALQAFATGGLEAVRIETLARDLGVTKGGFYWHFPDRSALVREMLETWERRLVDEVIDAVDEHSGEPREKLARLFAMASTRDDLLRVELAVRDLARRDEAVARRLRRVDNRRVQYMRSLFRLLTPDPEDVEARCYTAMALFVATDLVAADHDGHSRSAVVARSVQRLLT